MKSLKLRLTASIIRENKRQGVGYIVVNGNGFDIINNTFYANTIGLTIGSVAATGILKNNIFYAGTAHVYFKQFPASAQFDYNCFFDFGTGIIGVGGAGYDDVPAGSPRRMAQTPNQSAAIPAGSSQRSSPANRLTLRRSGHRGRRQHRLRRQHLRQPAGHGRPTAEGHSTSRTKPRPAESDADRASFGRGQHTEQGPEPPHSTTLSNGPYSLSKRATRPRSIPPSRSPDRTTMPSAVEVSKQRYIRTQLNLRQQGGLPAQRLGRQPQARQNKPPRCRPPSTRQKVIAVPASIIRFYCRAQMPAAIALATSAPRLCGGSYSTEYSLPYAPRRQPAAPDTALQPIQPAAG